MSVKFDPDDFVTMAGIMARRADSMKQSGMAKTYKHDGLGIKLRSDITFGGATFIWKGKRWRVTVEVNYNQGVPTAEITQMLGDQDEILTVMTLLKVMQ